MKTCIINHKKYTVEYRFNMVGNWYFTDKNGIQYLVDSEDVTGWFGDNTDGETWQGEKVAIAYAKEVSARSEDGSFWWKELV